MLLEGLESGEALTEISSVVSIISSQNKLGGLDWQLPWALASFFLC